jgi:hypothetical protein
MPGGFVWQQRGMRPAKNDRHAASAEFIRNIISVGRGTGGRRDADKVNGAAEANLTDNLIRMMDLNVPGRECREERHGQLRKPDQPPLAHPQRRWPFRGDKFQLHARMHRLTI